MDPAQIEANISLEKALRRANLLAAAAQVSHDITQIMEIDVLLPRAVDIICDAYDFYYAGVFLNDAANEFAVLRAGRGEPGRIMIENNHKLGIGGNSMIGDSIARKVARISLDVDTEKVWYPNPVLPETRSEMALPLMIGDRVIGAVTVQSIEAAAFSDEDISSLQAMADQLAIALDNARQRHELEETHAELLRARTYEAVATATGDAIHWIGNKAEPIRRSVHRIRDDLQLLICALAELLPSGGPGPSAYPPLAQLIINEAAALHQHNPELGSAVQKLNSLALDKLEKRLGLDSIFEDLQIIEEAALLIMKIKEDLIGPAREQAPRPIMAGDVIRDVVNSLRVPVEMVSIEVESNLPLVVGDPVQISRVFTNLIKNAQEALVDQPEPRLKLSARADSSGDFVLVEVSDNGPGIGPEDLDKLWITFHTTKGLKEHAGLGLAACRLILEQSGGHISVKSRPGQGATFTVALPVDRSKEAEAKGESGKGKILIVDDDDRWRQFAAATLEAGGYKVGLSAENYSADRYDKYDLILLDDILAGSDSLEVIHRLDRAGVVSKVVAISSNPRVEGTKDRMLLGLQDLIPKPYTRASLLSAVKKALTSRR